MKRLIVGVVALSAGAALAESGGLFTRGLAPLDLGRTSAAEVSAASCRDCHTAIWDEWAASRHAVAWTNGIFQREFGTQPLDWCVRCHAPLAKGDAASVDATAAEGVNCAVCHLRDGKMLATERRDGSPHDTEVRAELGTADYCAGCHQFAFPVVDVDKQVTRYTEHPMQDTVAEFHEGVRADQPGECLGCHGNSPAGHRYPGAHADGVVQHAIGMEVCRAGGDLRVSLTNRGAGHAVPTGDLHRHMILRAWRSNAPERLFEARIGRLFAPAPDGGKRVTEDTSIAPGDTREWEVPLKRLGGADEPVNVELRYVYTVDEVPLPSQDPGEPTAFTVHSVRVGAEELRRCR